MKVSRKFLGQEFRVEERGEKSKMSGQDSEVGREGRGHWACEGLEGIPLA